MTKSVSLLWVIFSAVILLATLLVQMFAIVFGLIWVVFTCVLIATWKEIPFSRRPLYGKKMRIKRTLKGRDIDLRAIMDRGVEDEEYVKYTIRWRTQLPKPNLDEVLEVLQVTVGPINRVVVESTEIRSTPTSPRAAKWKWEHEVDVVIRVADLMAS
ncbi:MAG: hypothetical protein ACW99U_12150 [Candidatus Thorarchaeota archaeon]|jgi:hypothetical protein